MKIARSGRAIVAAFALSSVLVSGPISAQSADAEEGESILELRARIKLANLQNELAVFEAEMENDAELPITTISKSQIRTQPPEQTHERLRDVVWDMFEVQDYREDNLGTRPLNVIALKTKPRSGRYKNQCRYDRIVVSFGMADASIDPDSEEASSSSPVKARELLLSTWWGFAAPPPITGRLGRRDQQSEDICASLPADHHFYRAPNGGAVEGYRAFMLLKRDIAAGRPFEMHCANKTECREEISDLAIESLRLVLPCKRGVADYCYRLEFTPDRGSAVQHRLTIQYDPDIRGDGPHIISVAQEMDIVLFHPRPD